jgi:phosphocarrier protein HPr
MNQIDVPLARTAVIVNELGLHARSAAKIAELAQNAKHKVWIANEAESVEAASIIDILTLGCAKGARVTIRIEHPEDQDILEQIVALVRSGFGE